jgi:hypothetical protein
LIDTYHSIVTLVTCTNPSVLIHTLCRIVPIQINSQLHFKVK